MDVMAHALYGATLCSRSGLAGGRRGNPGGRWYRDITVLWAVIFGLAPDIISMWIPFLIHTLSGKEGIFFVHYDGVWLELYRIVHSLLISLGVSAVIFLVWRSGFIPSLAWTVHILCDAVSHDEGKFQTLLFYPLSDWGIRGIPFWRHLWFTAAYWAVLLALIAGIILWRKKR